MGHAMLFFVMLTCPAWTFASCRCGICCDERSSLLSNCLFILHPCFLDMQCTPCACLVALIATLSVS